MTTPPASLAVFAEMQIRFSSSYPLLLFVDVVPYRTPAPEDGLLGVFPQTDLEPLHQPSAPSAAVRVVKVKAERLRTLLADFDPAAVRTAVKRFVKYAAASGKKTPPAESTLLDPALRLLSDLKAVCASSGSEVCIRTMTELEALLEPGMDELRRAANHPAVIEDSTPAKTEIMPNGSTADTELASILSSVAGCS